MTEPTQKTSPAKRRRKTILAMEAAAVILCAGVLIVGLTVASGLQSSAVEWSVKIGAVLLLALAWKAIPRVYDAYFSEISEDIAESEQRSEEGQ